MQDKTITRASKFMSLLLRHKPETIGLTLDPSGWAQVDQLVEKSQGGHCPLTRELIEAVVATNDKKRFRFSEDKTQICANQGHSLDVDLQLPVVEPPEILYHGTATRFLESIWVTGLQSRNRQHVHLSDNRETATNVGSRHGKPVLLTVDARAMYEAGENFYRSDNGVWLCCKVGPEYLKTD